MSMGDQSVILFSLSGPGSRTKHGNFGNLDLKIVEIHEARARSDSLTEEELQAD